MKTTLTLNQHIYLDQKNHPQGTGVFSEILSEIALVGKIISREVNKAGIAEIYGLTGDVNTSGDEVQKLDQFAQNTFVNILGYSGNLCAMASEEEEGLIPISAGKDLGKYVLIFDPLDGSSNIDANVSIGSIFSLYKRVTEAGPGTLAATNRRPPATLFTAPAPCSFIPPALAFMALPWIPPSANSF